MKSYKLVEVVRKKSKVVSARKKIIAYGLEHNI